MTSCDDGFYGDMYTRKCKMCNIACKTCKGPISLDCLTCFENIDCFKSSSLNCEKIDTPYHKLTYSKLSINGWECVSDCGIHLYFD